MDRPVVHRSTLPHSWSQPYPQSPSPNHTYPRPNTAPYPPYDHQNPYTASTFYPAVVSQQLQPTHPQPFPDPIVPVGYGTRPRGNSSSGDNGSYFQPPAPLFPSPAAPHFPQAHPFPHIPVPPSKPPALQPQLSGYPFDSNDQTQDVVPIRPPAMYGRRSSSSPATNRIPVPDVPPPIPPLPPNYQSNSLHIPPRVSPAPPPSIPIPSPSHSYRSDSSPLYDSPYDTAPPPLSAPHEPRYSSPPRFPTNSPPKFEGDVKKASVDEEEEALALAIALSEKESIVHSGKVSQEEEDFAKAIEESMRHASSFGIPISPTSVAGPSTYPKTTSPSPYSVPDYLTPSHPPPASPNTSRTPSSRSASKMPSPVIRPAQPRISDDEAFAQRLAEEEIANTAGPSNSKPQSPVLPSPKPESITSPAPASSSISGKRPAAGPSRFTVVNTDSEPSSASRKRREADQSKFAIINSDSEPPPPLYHHAISAQTSASAKTSPTLPNKNPALGRSTSASAVTPSTNSPSPVPGRSQSVDTGLSSASSTGHNPPVITKPNSLSTVEESSSSQSPSSPAGPVAPNSFIDQQLLNGVCKLPRTCNKAFSKSLTLSLSLSSPRVQSTPHLHYQDDTERRGPKRYFSPYRQVCAIPHPGSRLASPFEDDGSPEWI